MVYFGTFKNGMIVPEPGLRLPEGAVVRIEPVEDSGDREVLGPDPADNLSAEAVDIPITDASYQHDHYCSGTPKRPER